MSRSYKKNINRVLTEFASHEKKGGRVPKINKVPDHEVSHSKDCYLCGNGTKVKRELHIKPRRRAEQKSLTEEGREALFDFEQDKLEREESI